MFHLSLIVFLTFFTRKNYDVITHSLFICLESKRKKGVKFILDFFFHNFPTSIHYIPGLLVTSESI